MTGIKNDILSEKEINSSSRKLYILCWLAYCVSYIGRLHFSACMADIISDIGVTKTAGGAITTCFLICYGAGQLVNGVLGDKVHPRTMIFIGLLGAGTSNALISFCSSYYTIMALWGLNGVFNSMLWSPVIRCISEWVPPEKKQRTGVLISATIPCGTIISYLISSVVLKFGEWREVFAVCGGILVVFSVIWLYGMGTLKKYTSSYSAVRAENSESEKKSSHSNITLIKIIITYGVVFSVFGILFNGILKDGVTQWVPTYVKEFFSVSSSTASAVTSILPIINLSGAVVASALNGKLFKNELKTSASLFFLSAAAITGLYFFGSKNILLAVVLIAVSTASMLGVNSMFLTFIPLKFGKIGKAATVTGFLNACSYIASAISSVLIGYIAENKGWQLTILSWLAVGLMGALVCVSGVRTWRKGTEKLEQEH